MKNVIGVLTLSLTIALAGCEEKVEIDFEGPVAGWEHWGGDAGGTRFSPLTQVTPDNVRYLEKAWTYRIGEIEDKDGISPTLEATPVLGDGRLYVCSGLNRIAAIDPQTGAELWSYDAQADYRGAYLINCRGVTYWEDPAQPAQACAKRIFLGTLDGRLISLDAVNGRPCEGFGRDGVVSLMAGLGKTEPGDLAISSPPVVIDGKVVVGGRIPDNMRVDVPAGVIRAFDVHTGELVWDWNPLPPNRSDEEAADSGEPYVRGTPNAWAALSIDPERNLIFLPMGNASPDHISAQRDGRDFYAASVVALDASDGEVRWHFRTVHHDVWDYDLPAQPVLFDLPTTDGVVPALALATKQGHLFMLNRETGEPISPVEERKVSQLDSLPNEQLSPTQPFPVNPAFVLRRELTEDDIWGFTPWDKARCMDKFRSANWEGVFTPPSERGTIFYPSFLGTSNWGGVSVDPSTGILVANTNHVPAIVRMVPREETDRRLAEGELLLPAIGAEYGNTMEPMLSPFGAPCVRPPWGTLVAIDLRKGERLWEVPLGTTRDTAPFPLWMNLGVPNMGGSVITASGLIFIGATTDNFIRAFDLQNGEELWKARLPAGGQATPMTYRMSKDGKQYVVIAAGGHKYLGTDLGDYLVAYALPD